MRLLALNEQWAVFDHENPVEEFNTFEALQDILSIKNYAQLIQFLKKHACNTAFAQDSDTDFDDAFNRPNRIWRTNRKELQLKGNLNTAIDAHPDIDYLDQLVIDDLSGQSVYQIYLPELIDFQETMRRFLSYAAVSLGAKASETMFTKIDPTLLFGKEWIKNNLDCLPSELTSLGFPEESIGAGRERLISDDVFDRGIFKHLDKYSRYQLVIDENQEFGRYTDGYPLSTDKVIYTYEEYPEQTPDSDSDSSYYLTVTFTNDVDEAHAKKLLAGRAVEALLNTGLEFTDQNQFRAPIYDDSLFESYSFNPESGFHEKKELIPKWWVDELFNETIRLILQNKVTLCPVCGAPVLIRDFRGRKSKFVCSDSCKTKASNQRKETAYRYASTGVSIENAIERIGIEYENSIRKWYKDAQSA